VWPGAGPRAAPGASSDDRSGPLGDGADPAVEAEARFALDQAWAALTAQRADLADLQSRAKDLIGFLTLAGSFLGAFGVASANRLPELLGETPAALVALLALVPSLTFAACLYVLAPSTGWRFAVDSRSVAASMAGRAPDVGFDDVAQVHLFYAEALRRLLDANTGRLRRRMWALWVAVGGLAVTTVLVVGLVVA
jgi:hypothetical protein